MRDGALLLTSGRTEQRPGAGRCIACGRRLIDPDSRARGYGPVCSKRMPLRGGRELLGRREDGFFAQVVSSTIVVVDQAPKRTEADAWTVVQQLRGEGFNVAALPILYRSMAGRWSRLRLPSKETVDALPLQATEYADARMELWRQLQGER